MKDEDVDDVIARAARGTSSVDPALLERISQTIGSSLQPVKPLPSSWLLTTALCTVCVGVAICGALVLGAHGFQLMSPVQIGLIFPVLGMLAVMAAALYVDEMIPGSRRWLAPWALVAAASLIMIAVFALLFHDYGIIRFLPQGLICLKAGLLEALPVALAGWWILHRGFAVNSIAAGIAQGTLAGLAGVSMLELHCVDFQAPHQMLWHTSILPITGAAGALFAWTRQNRSH